MIYDPHAMLSRGTSRGLRAEELAVGVKVAWDDFYADNPSFLEHCDLMADVQEMLKNQAKEPERVEAPRRKGD